MLSLSSYISDPEMAKINMTRIIMILEVLHKNTPGKLVAKEYSTLINRDRIMNIHADLSTRWFYF
jgi:hypothetical protein